MTQKQVEILGDTVRLMESWGFNLKTMHGQNSAGIARKLFDGVRDNLGYELHLKEDQTENFFEMDLTKVAPSFNKVAVHGLNVDGMTIQLRMGDELIAPAVENVATEQYSTAILLKETVKPDGLRLIFPQATVELYEIEVF